MSEDVYIGLGSNLENPRQQIETAIRALQEVTGIEVLRISGIYHSKPMGPQDQPDYMNAVVLVHTSLSPDDLLKTLQQIEQSQGRVRKRHWGERTIDLDILLYGSKVINTPDLVVPHPGIPEREFVLYPLQEIAPELVIPGLGSVKELTRACKAESIEYLGGAKGVSA